MRAQCVSPVFRTHVGKHSLHTCRNATQAKQCIAHLQYRAVVASSTSCIAAEMQHVEDNALCICSSAAHSLLSHQCMHAEMQLLMFAQVRIFAEMQHKQNNALRICSTEQSSLQAHLVLHQTCNIWSTIHCAFAVAQRIRFCRINAYMQKCNYSCLRKCALPDGPCIWVQCETACFGTCYVLLRVWHPQAHMLSISSQCVCVCVCVCVRFVVQSSNSFCCTSCFQSSIVRVGRVLVFYPHRWIFVRP